MWIARVATEYPNDKWLLGIIATLSFLNDSM